MGRVSSWWEMERAVYARHPSYLAFNISFINVLVAMSGFCAVAVHYGHHHGAELFFWGIVGIWIPGFSFVVLYVKSQKSLRGGHLRGSRRGAR